MLIMGNYVSQAYTLTHSETECLGTETAGVVPILNRVCRPYMVPQGLTLATCSQLGLNPQPALSVYVR
jgi:hypothetical protein